MSEFKGTAQELADFLTVDYAVASALMKYLVAGGYAKDAGKKDTGKRPAQMFEVKLKFEMELKPVTIEVKPRKKKEEVVEVAEAETKNEVLPVVETVAVGEALPEEVKVAA